MVMTTAEWFGLLIFLVIITLLFFAAFGGTNITDDSVEEYMKRLIGESEGDKNK
jgi:hypothetical protein|tara:strand:- start:3272 stop:3433 length:162 start_codon:yes stop_codon:yes gene_type:complete